MKNVKSALFLFILIGAIGMTSCKKDGNSLPISISSEYIFDGISSNNPMYGYTKTNGQLQAIPSSDIAASIFAECNQVQKLDEIIFSSETNVSYKAYNEYDDATRNETTSFKANGNLIGFDWKDDFGNPYGIIAEAIGDEIRIGTYSYVTVTSTGSNFEVYLLAGSLGNGSAVGSTQIVGEDDILNRANGLDEGETIYLMSYEQIYAQQ